MAGTGDKLMTASEIKEVTDTKLVKDFSSLTALSGTPATGDLVPIKSGNDTYKIDYNALASAILGQISSNGVVNIANGGTGSNSATGALSGLIGALDTSSGFSLSDTIPVSINGTAYTIAGSTLSNVIVGGGTGVTATLPIANGGTGAASASDARTALDVYSKSETTSAIAQSTAISAPSIAAKTGFTSELYARKSGNIVSINGYIMAASAFTTSETSIATIDAGARPVATVRFPVALASAAYNPPNTFGVAFINSAGLINIVAPSGNTNKVAYFSVSYVAQN